MERLKRELEKCNGGTKQSEMQMKATILGRISKRPITDHYDLFVEPFKNRMKRENGENNKDGKGKHLALNTTSEKGGW